MSLPALFLSHGSPGLILEDCPARDFLAGLGRSLPKPKAILVASAHWETDRPLVASTARPETIHDFFGFPKPLYDIRYNAPGAPALAERVGNLLLQAGFDPALDPRRGLDHGAWAPLHLAFPAADIPTFQLSIQSDLPAEHHRRLGVALRPLRDEGVLIVGSGSATHDLTAFRRSRLVLDSPKDARAAAFADWLAGAVTRGDTEALLDWEEAPGARANHPSPEHFLPFFVALGAGTPGKPGRELHRSWTYGVLAMDAYAFD